MNIYSEDDLAAHLEGCDAVISCLGIGLHPTKIHNPDKIYRRSIETITAAMRRTNVKRLVCMSSWYTEGRYCPTEMIVYHWFC